MPPSATESASVAARTEAAFRAYFRPTGLRQPDTVSANLPRREMRFRWQAEGATLVVMLGRAGPRDLRLESDER